MLRFRASSVISLAGYRMPVVLVTSRASDADRARGVTAGANAYLTKSAFDQKELLQTLAQLL